MLPAALRALGWVENENFVFERRYAEGRPDRLPDLAADLVRAKPDIILAVGNPETAATKHVTSSIPIVMMFGLQPIETGLVPSLARPGGNVTGMVWVTPEYAGKILEVVKETVPKANTIAVLWDPTNPGHAPAVRAELERAARAVSWWRQHSLSTSDVTMSSLSWSSIGFRRSTLGGHLLMQAVSAHTHRKSLTTIGALLTLSIAFSRVLDL